jgi:hypothetical protein
MSQIRTGWRIQNSHGELPWANDGKLYHVNPASRNCVFFFFFQRGLSDAAIPFYFLERLWSFSKNIAFMNYVETCVGTKVDVIGRIALGAILGQE